MRILGIETSCDETAVAVVENGTNILGSAVATSAAFHERFGGILPELASRKQLDFIIPTLSQVLCEIYPEQQNTMAKEQLIHSYIDAIAVTIGPGLIGSLLVGVETAKTIAMVTKKPLIPVNHVHAHIYANFVKSSQLPASSALPGRHRLGRRHAGGRSNAGWSTLNSQHISFPAIALVVSGGHTELFFMKNEKNLTWLGGTIDDAAGETFDKTARLLGFGNRGGQAIEEAAQKFKIQNSKFNVQLPRPLLHDKTLNFSFSGLKTATLREWNKYTQIESPTSNPEPLISAFAHEIQEAITEVLVAKTLKAAKQYTAKSILLSGGVAANQRLCDKFKLQLAPCNVQLVAPPVHLCTDNAISIASCAYFLDKKIDWRDVSALPNLSVEI